MITGTADAVNDCAQAIKDTCVEDLLSQTTSTPTVPTSASTPAVDGNTASQSLAPEPTPALTPTPALVLEGDVAGGPFDGMERGLAMADVNASFLHDVELFMETARPGVPHLDSCCLQYISLAEGIRGTTH